MIANSRLFPIVLALCFAGAAQKALDQVKPLEQKGKELLRWLR